VPAGGNAGWGWHRLTHRWAEQLVADAGVRPGDLVLDVGAGDGALTGPLVAAGARVVAVELHPGRAALLRRRFAGRPVTVVRTDARDLRLPRRPFQVVASPPYGITAPLLRRLTSPGSRLVSAHLLLQHAAARRWAAGGVARPGGPGSDRRRAVFETGLGRRVPRSAFRPPPAVDSTVLVVRRRH
jgi:23S rRNA (adenine-N6)-dimethyltransferase